MTMTQRAATILTRWSLKVEDGLRRAGTAETRAMYLSQKRDISRLNAKIGSRLARKG